MSLGSDVMNKGMKISLALVGTLLIMIGVVACGGEAINPGSDEVNTSNPQETDNNGESIETNETQSLTFYYVDEQLVEILQEERDIQFSSDEEKWKEAWSALQNSQDKKLYSLWENVDLIEANLKDSQLVLNLALPDQLQQGSSAEGLAIQTLINTFGQFKGVETIQLLVDGEVIETLSGHVSIEHPFAKDDVIYSGE